MKLLKIFILFSLLSLLPAANLSAFSFINLFRHSEMAQKNTLFIDVSAVTLVFNDVQWSVLPVNISITYLPPLPLPFSFGLFMQTPNPNLKNFGFRAAYHIDLNSPLLDVYLLYCFNLGFIRNDVLEEHNDEPVPLYLFDFRIGLRRSFGFFGASVETGFKFESVVFSLFIKIN